MERKMNRKPTIVDEHMSQVIYAGGLPLRRGDYIAYLDEVAKSQDTHNWLRLRDASLLGNYQFNERHGYPPEGTKPLTLVEFKQIVEA